MAILMRTCVIIAGHHGVYVRLPSEHSDEPILRCGDGGITQDWLQDKIGCRIMTVEVTRRSEAR